MNQIEKKLIGQIVRWIVETGHPKKIFYSAARQDAKSDLGVIWIS